MKTPKQEKPLLALKPPTKIDSTAPNPPEKLFFSTPLNFNDSFTENIELSNNTNNIEASYNTEEIISCNKKFEQENNISCNALDKLSEKQSQPPKKRKIYNIDLSEQQTVLFESFPNSFTAVSNCPFKRVVDQLEQSLTELNELEAELQKTIINTNNINNINNIKNVKNADCANKIIKNLSETFFEFNVFLDDFIQNYAKIQLKNSRKNSILLTNLSTNKQNNSQLKKENKNLKNDLEILNSENSKISTENKNLNKILKNQFLKLESNNLTIKNINKQLNSLKEENNMLYNQLEQQDTKYKQIILNKTENNKKLKQEISFIAEEIGEINFNYFYALLEDLKYILSSYANHYNNITKNTNTNTDKNINTNTNKKCQEILDKTISMFFNALNKLETIYDADVEILKNLITKFSNKNSNTQYVKMIEDINKRYLEKIKELEQNLNNIK